GQARDSLMKTAFITGATGALGRAVIARLQKGGHWRVVATSRHCDDESGLQLDVRNGDQLIMAIEQTEPDLILHLAATFAPDFDEAYAVNVTAGRLLLSAAQRAGRRTRILLVGSAAEYGVVGPGESPIKEDRVLNPVSIYGLTKAWQTHLATLYASLGVDVVVARVFNLDGPRLGERLFVGRLQRQIEECLAGRRSMIELGPLSAIRDYVSIDEAVDQIFAIAARGKSGLVYHVASGKPIMVRDVLMRYLVMHNLDYSIVREASDFTNHIGYDVPEIYADVTSTMGLMTGEGICVAP
ncbi:MAG: NAD-dependent epimerase/dehydratase family protein, partial [Nitrososphaerota archaeon]|nr:NAD-dependent epimerase/dehydratase family protein [Nitrososphaerota archaeon]